MDTQKFHQGQYVKNVQLKEQKHVQHPLPQQTLTHVLQDTLMLQINVFNVP